MRGEVQNRSISLRQRRSRQHLTGQRKIETEMMRETVGGRRRRIMLIFQAEREDTAAAVIAIVTRLALRDPRQ